MNPRLDPDRSLWDLIAAEVRRQRECAGLSSSALARHMDVDRSTVSRIETGLRHLTLNQAEKLDSLWDTWKLFTRLVGFAISSDDGDWFTGLTTYEERAKHHRMWESLVIPGLLQTPDYARTVIAAGRNPVEPLLEERLARQAAVHGRPDPPEISVILNWAVLEQRIGARTVMVDQMAHLLEITERPNVRVRVLEKDAGAHVGLDGSFRLLTVDDRDVAFAAAAGRGRLAQDASDVQDYSLRYDLISSLAAPMGASRALIERAMETE